MTSKGLKVWYLVKKYLEKEHHKIVKENIPLKTVEGLSLDIIEKELKALDILKAFDFVIEDYTKELNGSMCVSQRRIILDPEEIDLLKEILKNE